MNFFERTNGDGLPTIQDFIWVAEYLDGTTTPEFNQYSKQETSFYNINKSNLLNFGMIGHGMSFYFNTIGGTFHIKNTPLDFAIKINDKEYKITDSNINCRDIIQYKDAESLFAPGAGISTDRVNQFNIGYKTKLNVHGVNLFFQPILKIPYGNAIYIEVKMTSDKDVNGEFIIYKNKKEMENIKLNMQANMSGYLNWIVR